MDERVLLVEDDPSIREIATLGLTQAGFRVTTAPDGREALLHFHQTAFDLVILDVMLPTLDGYEVCRQIRGESRVPIIMLSAKSDTVDVADQRLRAKVEDDPKEPRMIKTVRGVGYRFDAH